MGQPFLMRRRHGAAAAAALLGATRPAQIAQNTTATSWALAPDKLAEIDRITAPPRAVPAP